jgi:hypothetical protein
MPAGRHRRRAPDSEGDRLFESRNDLRGAFPGIDQPSQLEPGVECFRRDSESPPFPSEKLAVTLVVLALTEKVPKVARRFVARLATVANTLELLRHLQRGVGWSCVLRKTLDNCCH